MYPIPPKSLATSKKQSRNVMIFWGIFQKIPFTMLLGIFLIAKW
jgi:hypothetical protein